MQIMKFWIVTKADNNSELGDILFSANMRQLELQFAGGLSSADIIGVFSSEKEAENVALDVLYEIQCGYIEQLDKKIKLVYSQDISSLLQEKS